MHRGIALEEAFRHGFAPAGDEGDVEGLAQLTVRVGCTSGVTQGSLAELVECRHDPAAPAHELLAAVGGHVACVDALEQARPRLGFQVAHSLGHGLAGHMQPLGRLCERAAVVERDDVAQVSNVHGALVTSVKHTVTKGYLRRNRKWRKENCIRLNSPLERRRKGVPPHGDFQKWRRFTCRRT